MKTTIASFAMAAFVVIGVACYAYFGKTHQTTPPAGTTGKPAEKIEPSFRTVKIHRGDLLRTIKTTGIVRPEELVEVGAQVTGQIVAFGHDESGKSIDYGMPVRKNMVLAQIDPTLFQAQVDSATASLKISEANLMQYTARSHLMEHEWQRAKSLVPEQAIADTDFQQATSDYEVAKAVLALGHAAVQQSNASLRVAQTNLNYTTIRSPVDGIIIDRRVNIGQTVVSAFNAPSLFVIAKDLRRVQVWASVNEADIGQIQLGQTVQFTLDTYQDQLFSGKVSQIRLNALRTGEPNSAIYTVIVAAANSSGILPYLTANVEFEVQRRPNVLLIPTVALNSQPTENATSPTSEPATKNGQKRAGGLFCFSKSAHPNRPLTGCRRLWVKEGKAVHPLDVQLGLSNDEMTEIISPNAKEGMDVVLGPSHPNHGV